MGALLLPPITAPASSGPSPLADVSASSTALGFSEAIVAMVSASAAPAAGKTSNGSELVSPTSLLAATLARIGARCPSWVSAARSGEPNGSRYPSWSALSSAKSSSQRAAAAWPVPATMLASDWRTW